MKRTPAAQIMLQVENTVEELPTIALPQLLMIIENCNQVEKIVDPKSECGRRNGVIQVKTTSYYGWRTVKWRGYLQTALKHKYYISKQADAESAQ